MGFLIPKCGKFWFVSLDHFIKHKLMYYLFLKSVSLHLKCHPQGHGGPPILCKFNFAGLPRHYLVVGTGWTKKVIPNFLIDFPSPPH